MSLPIDMLIDIPRKLPLKERLLKHPGQQKFHPDPESNRAELRTKGFQRKLQNRQQVTLGLVNWEHCQ